MKPAGYRCVFLMGAQQAMAYRADFFLGLASCIFPIIMQVYLWTALYKAGAASTNGYSYNQMILYTLLAGMTSRLVATGFENEIARDIKDGGLNKYLIRPVPYAGYMLARFLGGKAASFGFLLLLAAGVLAGAGAVLGAGFAPGRFALYAVSRGARAELCALFRHRNAGFLADRHFPAVRHNFHRHYGHQRRGVPAGCLRPGGGRPLGRAAVRLHHPVLRQHCQRPAHLAGHRPGAGRAGLLDRSVRAAVRRAVAARPAAVHCRRRLKGGGKMKRYLLRLRHYLGLLGLFAKYSLMEQMAYRVNWVAGITVECGYMLIKLMYALLILQAGGPINGLSTGEMLMCVGTYIALTGLYMGVYPNFWALPLSVQDGSLDMLLTKPVNTQFLVTLRKLDFGMPIPNVTCGAALVAYGWQRAGLPVTPAAVAGFLVYFAAGLFLTYCLFLIPELLAFWFVANNGVQALSAAVYDFNNTPMNLYPKWLQRLGMFVLPVFVITNFPTLFVMGALPPALQAWGLAAPVLVFAVQRFVWKRAMRRYTSANG